MGRRGRRLSDLRDILHHWSREGFEMLGSRSSLVLSATLALGSCTAAPPTGPAVLALPPEGKDLARFQQEDGSCRQYASAQIGYGSPAQAATQSAVGSAAVGTAVGVGAGALLRAPAGGARNGGGRRGRNRLVAPPARGGHKPPP